MLRPAEKKKQKKPTCCPPSSKAIPTFATLRGCQNNILFISICEKSAYYWSFWARPILDGYGNEIGIQMRDEINKPTFISPEYVKDHIFNHNVWIMISKIIQFPKSSSQVSKLFAIQMGAWFPPRCSCISSFLWCVWDTLLFRLITHILLCRRR